MNEEIKEKSIKWWNSLGDIDKQLTFKERIYYSPLVERPKQPNIKQVMVMYKLHNNLLLCENDYGI